RERVCYKGNSKWSAPATEVQTDNAVFLNQLHDDEAYDGVYEEQGDGCHPLKHNFLLKETKYSPTYKRKHHGKKMKFIIGKTHQLDKGFLNSFFTPFKWQQQVKNLLNKH